MWKYIIPLCAAALSSISFAIAQVPETPSPPAPQAAQESVQLWEFKTVRNVRHISGNTWEDDGVRMSAPSPGWSNTYGAQGWELFDVEYLQERDLVGNPAVTAVFFFKRPIRSAN
jgi:hypothetical protein